MIENQAYLALFTVLLAGGQLLFKKIGASIHGLSMGDTLVVVLRQPTLYAALSLYGISTMLWIWILSRIPLSQAYPWVSIGTAIVPLMAIYFFGERVTPGFWCGLALIMVGIVIVQYSSTF